MVPAHSGIPGNEKAGVFARAAANQAAPYDDVPDELRWEASLAPMTRSATKAKSQSSAEGFSIHVGTERWYRALPLPPAPAQQKKRVGRKVLLVPLRPRSDRIASQRKDSQD